MTTKNHWGRWVDSKTPITGVHSHHDVAWEFIDDEICTICSDVIAEIADQEAEIDANSHRHQDGFCNDCGGECEYDDDGLYLGDYPTTDEIECDSSHTKLIGDWTTTDNLEEAWFEIGGEYYTPNKDGEFAAIENETTVQVVWSKYTERHGLCSPCYPAQADVDSDGEFLCYVLPAELTTRCK